MKKVVALSFDLKTWQDVHLLKDCGLIPYHFFREYNYEVTMVGAQLGEYPSIDKYLDGMQLEFLSDNTYEARTEYIIENAKGIDLLILEGVYSSNLIFAQEYKKRNPQGKVYLQTDMNSGYNEWVFSACPELVNLNEYVDVIASSGRKMQHQMNKKLPWCVEYIPNGYFDKLYTDKIYENAEKKNIILSVGRLGTWQKATDILLKSFANASERISDWELHLVGTVEEDFNQFIVDYFTEYPYLKDKIVFCGPIYDKVELANKYTEAKVFVLPSRFEGGTPNVVAEALISGCTMVVTKFDAYEDVIESGKCGIASDIDDINGLAESMVSLCSDDSMLADMSKEARRYALENFDYNKIIRRLHFLLFGEC